MGERSGRWQQVVRLLLLRGDHELNEIKAAKLDGLSPFDSRPKPRVIDYLGCSQASLDQLA